jgi:hypothetical protein
MRDKARALIYNCQLSRRKNAINKIVKQSQIKVQDLGFMVIHMYIPELVFFSKLWLFPSSLCSGNSPRASIGPMSSCACEPTCIVVCTQTITLTFDLRDQALEKLHKASNQHAENRAPVSRFEGLVLYIIGQYANADVC